MCNLRERCTFDHVTPSASRVMACSQTRHVQPQSPRPSTSAPQAPSRLASSLAADVTRTAYLAGGRPTARLSIHVTLRHTRRAQCLATGSRTPVQESGPHLCRYASNCIEQFYLLPSFISPLYLSPFLLLASSIHVFIPPRLASAKG